MFKDSHMAVARARHDAVTILPEKTILYDGRAAVNQSRVQFHIQVRHGRQFAEMRCVSFISIRLLRRRAASVSSLSSGWNSP